MNRETFMHSIDITDSDIISAFESIMALYCLYNNIGEYDNIKISKTSSELASFDILFSDTECANRLITICNGLHINIYNIYYNVSCELDGTTVHIVLKQ